jgi:hypothetical protein
VISASSSATRHAAWLLACIVFAAAAQGEEIHKCLADAAVAYQNAPCSDNQIDAGVLRLPDYADPPQRDGAAAPAAQSPTVAEPTPAAPSGPVSQAGFPFRRSVALGMTDDQILNTPQWGRPTRISRTRERGAWREVWVYARPDGVRELSFVNGRLENIDVGADAPARVASARSR